MNQVRGVVGEMPNGEYGIRMQWEVGRSVVHETLSNNCNFDGSKCYTAKSVPVIFEVSRNEGYTNGYQNLTIHGHGLGSGEIVVKVDGVDCIVTTRREDAVNCELGVASAISAID